jgi:hypothetical protein
LAIFRLSHWLVTQILSYKLKSCKQFFRVNEITPSSNGIGYAYFCAWEVPENKARTHTDGVPVQYTNWKTQYKSAFKQLAEDAVAELKFKKDDERTARALQRRV